MPHLSNVTPDTIPAIITFDTLGRAQTGASVPSRSGRHILALALCSVLGPALVACGGGQGAPAGPAGSAVGANVATGGAALAAQVNGTPPTAAVSPSLAGAATGSFGSNSAAAAPVGPVAAAGNVASAGVTANVTSSITSSGMTASALALVGAATDTRSSSQPPLADCGLNEHIDVLLQRINALRAQGASCGARGRYAPAQAVVWNTRLYAAAMEHSTDMASANYFAHTSPSGQTLLDRLSQANYDYSLAAENIAAGQTSVDSVLASWMASDGHCANLMHPKVREIGLACSRQAGARYVSYWTLTLGASR
ncbi:MAG: hypothetical protein RIQ60_2562 [Pseudomonadota bacterium]|jgi:uncharacterized protein YkwD